MKNSLLVPELMEMIEAGQKDSIRSFCTEGHPVVVAEMVSALPVESVPEILRALDAPLQAKIFRYLDEDVQLELIDLLKRDEAAHILTGMPPDDRADFVKRIPEEKLEAILPAVAQAEREDIRKLTAYREGTAGAVMTSDYAALTPGLTVSEALEQLRLVAPDRETIYYAYVLDESRKLLGFVSLKDLILAKRGVKLKEIMHRDAVSASVDDDQEDAAHKIRKYNLIALPVLDSEARLAGIITHDDAFDIITQEHTEDAEKFMAITGSHEPGMYMKTPVFRHFRNRAGWLVALAALGLVSGWIVQSFDGLLRQFAILVAFMPMLADTGGNTGSQAATLVIRALALREVSPKDVLKVLFKEARVALLLAVLLGFLAFARAVAFGGVSDIPEGFSLPMIGGAIGLALGLQVITATLIGALLPLTAARFRLDPAIVASPTLTTLVDISGLMIYFVTVKLLLNL